MAISYCLLFSCTLIYILHTINKCTKCNRTDVAKRRPSLWRQVSNFSFLLAPGIAYSSMFKYLNYVLSGYRCPFGSNSMQGWDGKHREKQLYFECIFFLPVIWIISHHFPNPTILFPESTLMPQWQRLGREHCWVRLLSHLAAAKLSPQESE